LFSFPIIKSTPLLHPIDDEELIATFQLFYTTCGELLRAMNYILNQGETLDSDDAVNASHLLMIQLLTRQLEATSSYSHRSHHSNNNYLEKEISHSSIHYKHGFIRNFYTVREYKSKDGTVILSFFFLFYKKRILEFNLAR
jgi:hypothetical protein